MTPRRLCYNCRNSLDNDHNVDNIYLRNSFCCVNELINENGSSIQEKIYEPSVWFEVSNNTWHWISDRHDLVVKWNVVPLSLRKRRRGMRRKLMSICNIYVRRFGLCCHFKICSTVRKIGPRRAKSSGCYKLSWVGGSWRWELKGGFLLHASPV